MGISVGVGRSNNPDPYEAGREVVRCALEEMGGGNPDFLFLFSVDAYDQERVLEGVRSLTKANLSGCCGAGVITKDGFFKDSIALMAIESDRLRFFNLLEKNIVRDPYSAGEKVIKSLLRKKGDISNPFPDTFIMLPEGFECNIGHFLRGSYSVTGPESYIVGGGTGDNLKFFRTYQFSDNEISSDGASATLIISSNPVGVGFGHGWSPVGIPLSVTRAEGRLVMEIDGEPAFSSYLDYFKDFDYKPTKENFSEFGMKFPLGIPQMGEYVIRDPLKVLPDGSIFCVSEVPENSLIRIMKTDTESVISATRAATEEAVKSLQGKTPAFALVFDCISRLLLLKEDAPRELKMVQEVLGEGVPILGFHTFGEIVSGVRGAAAFYNKSIVIWVASHE